MQYAAFVSRSCLGVTLVAASVAKVSNFAGFALTVRALLAVISPRLGRRRLATTAAEAFVFVEGCTGVLVVSGFAPIAGATASVTLILLFAAAAFVAVSRGAQIECNCFGGTESVLGRETLVRAALLAAATAAYVLAGGRASQPWWPTTPSSGSVAFGLTCAAILGARWLLAAPQLNRLRRKRLEEVTPSELAGHAIRVVAHPTSR